MLKIVKGLKPEGIMTYTEKGVEYVRVKTDDEDFCIAAHDYNQGVKYYFSWDNAKKAAEADGLTLLTLKQVRIYKEYLTEINSKLKEICDEALKSGWYWTSNVHRGRSDPGWLYFGSKGIASYGTYSNSSMVRPILNLK